MLDSKLLSAKGGKDGKDGDIIMSESDIVSRFNEIYDSTNKYILAFITAKCGNLADVSDIFQETYMELYQLMTKRGTGYITSEKALVLKIAKRKIARYYTLLERMQMFVPMTVKTAENEDNESVELELSEMGIDSFLTEDSVEDYVVSQILLETARNLIRQKPPEIEKIFYLFYDAGLTIPEIAKTLSLSESNVKNKLYRTVKELQDLLKKEG